MKKMILALVAAMTMTSVQAQDNNSPARGERRQFDRTEMLKQRTDETVKKYGLNEEQAAKLLELNTKYADKTGQGAGAFRGGRRDGGARQGAGRGGNRQRVQRAELTEEQKQNMAKQREERQQAAKAYAEELQAIMTPDQYKAYQADMEKNMKENSRRGGPRNAEPRKVKKQE